MRKNIWSRGLLGTCIVVLLVSPLLPSVPVLANEEGGNNPSVEKSRFWEPYTEEAQKAYEEASKLIAKAKESGDLEDIRKAGDAFIAITPHLGVKNYYAYLPGDEMDEIFFEMMDLLYKVVPEENRKEELLRFAEKWSEVLIENYNSIYVSHFRYFITQMNDENDPFYKELEDYLREVNRYANGVQGPDGVIPLPTLEELERMLEDYYDRYGPDKPDPKPPTQEEIEADLRDKYPQLGGDDITGSSRRYEKIGNDWYEIIQYIRDGKVIKTDRRKLSLEESYFLRVRENPYFSLDNPFDNISYISEQEWDYIITDQNLESKYTIHYTVNKDEPTPYYYDTGIRVNQNKEATYEQYKDVLLILADKAEGFYVEDKNKVLTVLEGKPIVVRGEKQAYSKTELETVFSDFEKVDIRIMETRIGKTESLEEQIVSKQAKVVKVNGKNITLTTLPMVKNERALLPLEEIVQALEGTLVQDGDTFIAKKDKATIMYRLNDNSVYVNGKPIKLKNAPVYKDSVLMVEVGELATAFGFSMVWDGETSTINFEVR